MRIVPFLPLAALALAAAVPAPAGLRAGAQRRVVPS
jgi:hypothetical protein